MTKLGLPLECFDRNFKESEFNDVIIVGHVFKVARHFLSVAELTADNSYRDAAYTMTRNAISGAWDIDHGGTFHFLYRESERKSGEKVWWTMCEGLITLHMLFSLTGNKEYIDRFQNLAEFTFNHFNDSEYGEWITITNSDGTAKCTDKGGTLEKAAFHTVELTSYAAENL